jgi:pimeloyl-ACP methyl ester carboxylesterase
VSLSGEQRAFGTPCPESGSVAGSYAVPWLLGKPITRPVGFVAVTPVGVVGGDSARWAKARRRTRVAVLPHPASSSPPGGGGRQVETPALVVYGSADPDGLPRAKILSQMPRSRVIVFQYALLRGLLLYPPPLPMPGPRPRVPASRGASHPCYVDDPTRFNNLLVEFAAGAV